MVEVAGKFGPECVTVCIDFDERVIRVGLRRPCRGESTPRCGSCGQFHAGPARWPRDRRSSRIHLHADVFCVDEERAARMRQALVNDNKDLCDENSRYVMRITGSDKEGQDQLGNFIDPESKYQVLVTTSRLLSTVSSVRFTTRQVEPWR
jgi:hypothetical protein